MTWDAGPCLPAPEPVQPTTDEQLRALVTRAADPALRQNNAREFADSADGTGSEDELAARRRGRAPRT